MGGACPGLWCFAPAGQAVDGIDFVSVRFLNLQSIENLILPLFSLFPSVHFKELLDILVEPRFQLMEQKQTKVTKRRLAVCCLFFVPFVAFCKNFFAARKCLDRSNTAGNQETEVSCFRLFL